MAELVVIYDPALELAAIINTDERVSWGPAMIGPEAAVVLQSFIDNTPFDVSTLDTFTAAAAFADFLDKLVAAREATPTAADPGPLVDGPDPSVAAENVATTAQGAPTDEPPAPQPADTDAPVDANQSEASASIDAGRTPLVSSDVPAPGARTVQCALCDGQGTVQMDPSQPAAQCQMCMGTGTVTTAIPA